MKNKKRISMVLALMLIVCKQASAIAGPLEDGVAAYDRQDYKAALNILQPLADQGNAEAEFKIGAMYFSGWGEKEDTAEALKWIHKAADQGYAQAEVWFGNSLKNDEEAEKWYQKAAAQGDVGGEFQLGELYKTKNPEEAAKWFHKAADQGDQVAQRALAHIYSKGIGVAQDNVQAYMWATLARDNNRTLEQIASSMTPEQIAEANKLVAKWKPTAAITQTP